MVFRFVLRTIITRKQATALFSGADKSAAVFVVEAVGVRFFAPGTTPEMPLRRPLAERRKAGSDPVKPLDAFSVPAAPSTPSGAERGVSRSDRRPRRGCRTRWFTLVSVLAKVVVRVVHLAKGASSHEW